METWNIPFGSRHQSRYLVHGISRYRSGYTFAGARDGLDEEARRRMSAAVRGAMIMDFKLGFAPCPLNASGWTLMMKYPVLETYY